METADLLSNRLNADVALFMGCTLNEVIVLVCVSELLSLMGVFLPLSFVFEHSMYALSVSLLGSVLLFFILAMKLSKLKQNKPAGYYAQWVKIHCRRLLGLRSPLVQRGGAWSVGRNL